MEYVDGERWSVKSYYLPSSELKLAEDGNLSIVDDGEEIARLLTSKTASEKLWRLQWRADMRNLETGQANTGGRQWQR